jgi:GNAT superfamily N-acetyltransferase
MQLADGAAIRRATPADIPQLVGFRALMMSDMGEDFDAHVGLRDDVAAWYARRMGQPNGFAAFVAEASDGSLVGCAVGTVEDHAPSPRSRSGLRGELSNVVTLPAFRRRGLARACVSALLTWFANETDATTVRLAATADGAQLYRSMGFTEPRDVILQWRVER